MTGSRLLDDTLGLPSAFPLDGNELVRLVDDPDGTPVSAVVTTNNLKSFVLADVVDPPSAIAGQSFHSAVSKAQGTLSMVGDSNTDANANPAWLSSVGKEWTAPGGIFDGWTVYENAQNGTTVKGWADLIASADTGADPDEKNNPWAVVNANPDVIMIALGTNDLNSPGNRATIGTKPNLQANLETLVEFFLDNTGAAIWLRMPQPFAFEDFFGITDWADADEAASASQIVREVYENWVGRTPRVEVFNSHRQLFGLRCDDKATQCLDPLTAAPMITDSLHMTNMGYRRTAERMHMQSRGFGWKAMNAVQVTNLIAQAASWSALVYAETITPLTNSLIAIYGNPSHVRFGNLIGLSASTRAAPTHQMFRVEDHFMNSGDRLSAVKQLRFMRGRGPFKLFFPASGNSYTATDVILSDTVDGGGDNVQYRFQFNGANLTGEAAGPVLIYTEERFQHPFVDDAYVTLNIASGETQTLGAFRNDRALRREIVGGTMVRSGFSGVAGAADAYLVEPNNGVITGTLMGTFTFSSGLARTTFTINASNYPSGIKLNAGEYIIRMAGYSNIGQGQVSFLTRYGP